MAHAQLRHDLSLHRRRRNPRRGAPEASCVLQELTQNGQLAVSGPYVGGDRGGALLVFVAGSEAEARELSAQDPFVLEGLVEELTVREWRPVSGRLGDQF